MELYISHSMPTEEKKLIILCYEAMKQCEKKFSSFISRIHNEKAFFWSVLCLNKTINEMHTELNSFILRSLEAEWL